MAASNYKSTHTGAQLDSTITAVETAVADGGLASKNDLASAGAATQQFSVATTDWTGTSAPYTCTITHTCGLRPFVSIWSATSPYEEYGATIKSTSTTIEITSNIKVALFVQVMSSGATTNSFPVEFV